MDYSSVFFLHIPKTGGMSMYHVLQRQYHSQYRIGVDINADVRAFRSRKWDRLNIPKLVHGHMSFGLHQYVPEPTTYLTLLRDPISRGLSDYHYVTSSPNHPLYTRVKHMSLIEYFDSGITGQLSNGQTRLLSGDCLTNDPGIPSERPMVVLDLENAKNNISSHFTAVGILERFEESLMLFRRRLGWRWPFYLRQNVSPSRDARQPQKEELNKIRQLNELDLQLYESVREEFEEQINEMGPYFNQEVSMFKLMNKVWGTLVSNLPFGLRLSIGKTLGKLRHG